MEISSDAVDADFERFCQDVALPGNVKVRAWNVWCNIASKIDDNLKVRFPKVEWFVVTVYIASVDASMPYGPSDPHIDKQSPPCITVSELLKKAQMNVIEFFERMRNAKEMVVLSDAVKFRLTNLEKTFCIISPLFHKFDREWTQIFRKDEVTDNGTSGSVPFSQPEGAEFRKSLCWTLFIHAKDCLLSETQELVHTYHLLIGCLEYVLRSTPAFQLQQPFDMLRLKSTEYLDQNGYNIGILKKLAEHFHTNVEELQSMQSNTEAFFQGLKHTGSEIDLVTLRGLCNTRYRESGELDELQFLQHDPHLVPVQNQTLNTAGTSTMETPVTPVRAALATIQQLKNILANSQDEPCAELKEYFENCAQNPETLIINRVSDLRAKFVEKYNLEVETGSTTLPCRRSLTSEQKHKTSHMRFQMAVRLYYRVMKTLLDMEKERLSLSDFSHLLNNDTFHRSLLACSVEIVLMTYGVSWNPARCSVDSEDSKFVFPWILDVFNLYPYDFYKVLESFIKAEPNLTREIIKHLTMIENKILDRIAWQTDSPLFDAIAKSEPVTTTIISPSKDLTNGHSASAAELCGDLSSMSLQARQQMEVYLSPIRGQRTRGAASDCVVLASPRKIQSVSVVYTREGGDTKSPKRSHSLNMFFNKVCRLGYHRLTALCDLLQVPKDVQQKIWTCFEFCITCRTELMKNRHIDQMMMCSLYGICKVSENEIKFKDIVTAYRALQHADPQVFKHALIVGQEYDSIISFYNRVYMQNMKNFILQFAKPAQPNLSPVPRPVTSPLAASQVYSIPGRRNFYVSPLRESPFKAPQSPGQMTPKSRQLYSFGEGVCSGEKLRNINDSLSAFKCKNTTTPRSQKRLHFDAPDDSCQNTSPTKDDDEPAPIDFKKKRVDPQSVVHVSDPGVTVKISGKEDKSTMGR